MTKLEKPISREVTLNGKQYYVTLDPGNKQSVVSFKEKGKRGRNAPFFLIPLEELLDQLSGIKIAESGNEVNTDDIMNKASEEDEINVTYEETYGIPHKIRLLLTKRKEEWLASIDKWQHSK